MLFTDSEIRLSLISLMGGIEIVVPPNIAVICDGTCLLGGLEFLDKRNGGIVASLHAEQSPQEGGQKVLRLNCLSMLGGVEVKTEPCD